MRKGQKIRFSFVAVVVVAFAVLAVMGYYIDQTRALADQNHGLAAKADTLSKQNHSLLLRTLTLAKEGQQAKRGICAYKVDLRNRVKGTREFLHDHPEGVPGISAKVIRATLKSQEAALASLDVLDCSRVALPPK